MTTTNSSPVFSWCFLILLLWGCTTVASLVNTALVGPQETTPGYDLTKTDHYITNTTYGDITRTFGCGNKSSHCEFFCNSCEYLGEPPMACLNLLFQHGCLKHFTDAMHSLNNTEWCIWINVRSAYNTFTVCTEEIAECLLIPWPNPLVEQTFVEIHSKFFQDCPTEELSDPPPSIVFALVMTPICLIPVMVILVVLKTKNGDGSS